MYKSKYDSGPKYTHLDLAGKQDLQFLSDLSTKLSFLLSII